MDEYINKAEVLEKTKFIHGRWDDLYVSKSEILIMPAADVKPVVHGYWVEEPDRYFHWHCSECEYVISGPHREFNYCPKCGTKMHGDR